MGQPEICQLCLSLAQTGGGPCDSCRKAQMEALELEAQMWKEENQQLRELLWVFHLDHYRFLYGDDGERQCAKCNVDFKRDSVEQLRKGFKRGGGR